MSSKNFSRVYINPNFNRGTVSSIKHLKINAHLNANHPSTQNNKIYINPNFIPSIPQTVQPVVQCSGKINEKITSVASAPPSNTVSVHDNLTTQIQLPVAKKSRYSLVRCNENKPPDTKSEKTESLTLKLSKYKSIRITDVNSRPDREKQPPNQLKNANKYSSHNYDQKQKESIMNTSYNHKSLKTQYTYVRSKETAINTPPRPLKTRYSYIKSKDTAKRMHTSKQTPANISIKNTPRLKIRKLKIKCNTPCRLFRKYGKCLRNAKGHCNYLHDKKHVSICRKFLKGICHDKDCLLSHELSDKKMPTCFFYLQGMCTKERCPYLHVKVNEKAIVCPDFKKGYCEKGNKCLYRHVETTKKGAKKLLVDLKSKSKYQLQMKHSNGSKTRTVSEQNKSEPPIDQTTAVTDCRYYKEVIADDETNELQHVIKPTRCKLGTLPSFIKF